MSNVIDIHIHRTDAGKTIPFDKIYLFNAEDRLLIPKIFGYALVLPLSSKLQDDLYTLRPKEITRKHFYRNDSHKNIPTTIDNEVINGLVHKPLQIAQWWEELDGEINLTNRLVVVPILVSVVRRKIRPRYLITKQWFVKQPKPRPPKRGLPQVTTPISEFAYLATPHPPPDDAIRPICSICPRALLHLQGECAPGQDICYKSLDFSGIKEDSENAGVQQNND